MYKYGRIIKFIFILTHFIGPFILREKGEETNSPGEEAFFPISVRPFGL